MSKVVTFPPRDSLAILRRLTAFVAFMFLGLILGGSAGVVLRELADSARAREGHEIVAAGLFGVTMVATLVTFISSQVFRSHGDFYLLNMIPLRPTMVIKRASRAALCAWGLVAVSTAVVMLWVMKAGFLCALNAALCVAVMASVATRQALSGSIVGIFFCPWRFLFRFRAGIVVILAFLVATGSGRVGVTAIGSGTLRLAESGPAGAIMAYLLNPLGTIYLAHGGLVNWPSMPIVIALLQVVAITATVHWLHKSWAGFDTIRDEALFEQWLSIREQIDGPADAEEPILDFSGAHSPAELARDAGVAGTESARTLPELTSYPSRCIEDHMLPPASAYPIYLQLVIPLCLWLIIAFSPSGSRADVLASAAALAMIALRPIFPLILSPPVGAAGRLPMRWSRYYATYFRRGLTGDLLTTLPLVALFGLNLGLAWWQYVELAMASILIRLATLEFIILGHRAEAGRSWSRIIMIPILFLILVPGVTLGILMCAEHGMVKIPEKLAVIGPHATFTIGMMFLVFHSLAWLARMWREDSAVMCKIN